MKPQEINQLLTGDIFNDLAFPPILKETHISWVILSETHAYKIKKPVKFLFLDFSTLELRKYFCEREVMLNKRLAEKMYLDVIPIYCQDGTLSFSGITANIVDYAVRMNRMDTSKELDKLIVEQTIGAKAMEKLAAKIAGFHAKAPVIRKMPIIEKFKERFNDILAVYNLANNHLEPYNANIMKQAQRFSDAYLNDHFWFLEERALKGFVRDVHGDLHCANIFLYEDPVIFDCIEFNDELRQIDLLDEVAFLCMDLEAYGRKDLSEIFYRSYLQYSQMHANEETQLLFQYYKCYRANVRAKVAILNADGITAKRYLTLLKSYTAIHL
jgi:aminoglycoside phosphotransferase family enzyme